MPILFPFSLLTKPLSGWTQKIQYKNMEGFVKAVWERPRGVPLVTIANHTSYMDDPGFLRMCTGFTFGRLRGVFFIHPENGFALPEF